MEQFYSKKLKKWLGVLATGWGNCEEEAKYHCVNNAMDIERADGVKFIAACLRSEKGFHLRSYTFESGRVRVQMLQEMATENVAPETTGNHPSIAPKKGKAKAAKVA